MFNTIISVHTTPTINATLVIPALTKLQDSFIQKIQNDKDVGISFAIKEFYKLKINPANCLLDSTNNAINGLKDNKLHINSKNYASIHYMLATLHTLNAKEIFPIINASYKLTSHCRDITN